MSFSETFIYLIGLLLLICNSCVPAGGSGATQSGEAPTLATPLSSVPGVELRRGEDIAAMDFAVGERESLHLVWAVESSLEADASGGGGGRLLYVRGEEGGKTWAPPVVLAEQGPAGGGLRILTAPDGLHVLAGHTLRHFTSSDGGRAWRELAPLAPGQPAAVRFDAAAGGDFIAAALLVHPRVAYERAKTADGGGQKLYVVRWSPAGETPPALIASFPDSVYDPPTPRVLAEGRRLHLLCGVNMERPEDEKGGSVEGKLFYLRSEDAGSAWSAPAEISRGGAPGHTQAVTDLELLTSAEGLCAFYQETHLYVSCLTSGAAASPAARVTDPEGSAPGADYKSYAVSAAGTAGRGRLVWIDTRFRKSDRAWWNPLGGLPWSDDPEWANNDIFTLPFAGISAKEAQDHTRRAPARLTQPLSYARLTRLRAAPSRFFLFWSGRRKVGRHLDAYGNRTELFYTTLPFT